MGMWIIIFRTFILFLMLLVLMRLLGKRQLGELELSELVVSILFADAASVPLQDPSLPIWNGVIPCVTLFLCEYVLAFLSMKSVAFRKLVCGKPSFLVVDGVIQQKNMRRSRFTMDELAEELRNQSVNDIAAVQYAILETDGKLNVILRPDQRPPTCAQMGVQAEDDGYATILVQDGVLLERNLAKSGRNEKWLKAELSRRGCKRLKDVYALILYDSGKVFFAAKDKGT